MIARTQQKCSTIAEVLDEAEVVCNNDFSQRELPEVHLYTRATARSEVTELPPPPQSQPPADIGAPTFTESSPAHLHLEPHPAPMMPMTPRAPPSRAYPGSDPAQEHAYGPEYADAEEDATVPASCAGTVELTRRVRVHTGTDMGRRETVVYVEPEDERCQGALIAVNNGGEP